MAKLSDVQIETTKFKGRGLRPWVDEKVLPATSTPEPNHESTSQSNPNNKGVIKEAQKGDKRVTKRVQKGDKGVTKRVQKDDKGVTKRVQKSIQRDDKRVTKRVQKNHSLKKPSPLNQIDEFQTFFSLGGLQKKCVEFVYELINLNGSSDHCTIPVSMRHISEHLKIDINSLKKTFARLKAKGVLSSEKSRLGRNGCVQYKLSKDIYRDISISQSTNQKNNLSQLIADKKGTERVTDLSTSSSSNITTTTDLANEWSNIGLGCLRDHGFSDNHIQQISKLGIISPEDLQDSINYFIFDLLENNKASEIKKSPVAFFMGIIRGKGLYSAPPNYESVKDRVLRLKTEQLKRQQEKRERMEAELIDTEFKGWESGITDEEKEKLLPEDVKNSKIASYKDSVLKRYFKENFWPAIQQEKYADCF